DLGVPLVEATPPMGPRGSVVTVERPRARRDLEVHEREQGEQQVFIVHDPVLGTYRRLGPVAYAVLAALEDGQFARAELPAVLRARHGPGLTGPGRGALLD